MDVRWAVALAALGLSGCASSATCATDAQCGSTSICVELETQPGVKAKRCLPTCASDTDCMLMGRFGKSCRTIVDKASGPAGMELGDRYGRPNTNVTTRGSMKVCRDSNDVIK